MSNYRWLVLFACFLAFVAYGFAFQSMPPLVSHVAGELGVAEAQAGLLMSMAVIPGIVLALPAGLIVNRFGFRRLGLVSILLVAAGSIVTALSNSFALALLGRFVLGVGGAFIVVGAPTIIPRWFDRKDLGKAMGLYGANMPVATILAFPTATAFAQSFNDWHYPFYLGALLAVMIAVFFVSVFRRDPPAGEKTHDPADVRHAIRNSEVWKASLVWMFFNAAAIAYLSWAKTLFESFKGLPPLEASFLASVLMYTAVVFVPVFGWVSDKTRLRKPFMVVGSVAMACALIVTSYASGATLLLSVAVLGVTAATVPPAVMTVTSQSLPHSISGTAFSIVTLCQNIGIAFSAPYAGYIIHATSNVTATFLGISFLSFAAAAVALTLRTR